MKTYAGELYVELPGEWSDESTFVYRRSDTDIEVRVERSPVAPAATPDGLLDIMVERLKNVGPVTTSERRSVEIGGRAGRVMSVRSKGERDKDESLMEVAVFKATDAQVVTITALGPGKHKGDLTAAWQSVLTRTRLVDVK